MAALHALHALHLVVRDGSVRGQPESELCPGLRPLSRPQPRLALHGEHCAIHNQRDHMQV